MHKFQFLVIFFFSFGVNAQNKDTIKINESKNMNSLIETSCFEIDFPKTEINFSIDRNDFWLGLNYNARITKKMSIQPAFDLAIIKTFFQQNITPKFGLGLIWDYFKKHKYKMEDICVRPPCPTLQLNSVFNLAWDAGLTQTIARFGSQIQNETQFYIGHQLLLGRKNLFVFRIRAAIAIRQISGNSLSPFYFNLTSTLGIRCFG